MLLSDGDRAGAALLVNDGGGNHHVQVPRLGDHRVRVDLAHVVALVLGLDVPDVEAPGVVAVVDDVEPGDINGHRETAWRFVESSNLGILVMTWRPMVRIICRSMWTQATCTHGHQLLVSPGRGSPCSPRAGSPRT